MKITIIIMASGLSTRFLSNKLLAKFKGQSIMELILDKTADFRISNNDLQINRLVLTRTQQVYDYCRQKDVDVILHELPDRNDAIRLGIEQEHVFDSDACIFCACDQPLLRQESIASLIEAYMENGEGIYRLSYEDTAGNPILFSKRYFKELSTLPAKKGGAYLAGKHPNEVTCVEAIDKWELFDVDTPEDLVILEKVERD